MTPLPRLDDDQKYWEERCHILEKDLADARREVEELKGGALIDGGTITRLQREMERLKGMLAQEAASALTFQNSLVNAINEAAQAREKAYDEAADFVATHGSFLLIAELVDAIRSLKQKEDV